MARTATRRVEPRAYTIQWPGQALRTFNLPTRDALARSIPMPPEGTGYVYGMLDGEWEPVVPLSGVQMEGPLYLAREPEVAREGSTKRYVDEREFLVDGGFY